MLFAPLYKYNGSKGWSPLYSAVLDYATVTIEEFILMLFHIFINIYFYSVIVEHPLFD